MNAQVLIDSVVRQVTVLIAQLATSGGIRAPLAHVANQVFVELASELESQGVSRKVSADMFGMALRAYIRKVRRLSEAQTDQGSTLWQAVLDFIRQENLAARDRILERFRYDDELQVSGVLHDLLESGLIFCSGTGRAAVYRAASDEELGRFSQLCSEQGLDELAWVLIYRCGPIAESELCGQLFRPAEAVADVIGRLVADGRVQRLSDGRLSARDFVLPLGHSVGWEAAVFDHLQDQFRGILEVRCQEESRISPAFCQSGVECRVGAAVPAETKPVDAFVRLCPGLHQRACSV